MNSEFTQTETTELSAPSLCLSNDELVDAIRATIEHIKSCHQIYNRYTMLHDHLQALLAAQATRAAP